MRGGAGRGPEDHIVHLGRLRAPSPIEAVLEEVDLRIAKHFRQQAEAQRQSNQELAARLERLTNGIERLFAELDGVRTGRKEEAFARIGTSDASPDLPTVGPVETSLIYTLTSKQIGAALGFHASEIGQLLGPRGLRWAGDGAYQEVGRWQHGHMRYWHHEVPSRLAAILTEKTPAGLGITNKAVISIFVRWKARPDALAGSPQGRLAS